METILCEKCDHLLQNHEHDPTDPRMINWCCDCKELNDGVVCYVTDEFLKANDIQPYVTYKINYKDDPRQEYSPKMRKEMEKIQREYDRFYYNLRNAGTEQSAERDFDGARIGRYRRNPVHYSRRTDGAVDRRSIEE